MDVLEDISMKRWIYKCFRYYFKCIPIEVKVIWGMDVKDGHQRRNRNEVWPVIG